VFFGGEAEFFGFPFFDGIAKSQLVLDGLIDGVAKSPIYFVAAGREMLDVPFAGRRFVVTTAPWILAILAHASTFCEIINTCDVISVGFAVSANN
jgi:hypothetical protein